MKKTACIITGGTIEEDFLLRHLQNNQYSVIIVVDGALEITHRLHIMPSYIVGDFDTVDLTLLDAYNPRIIQRHLPQKDQTDTELAIKTAIEEQCTHLVLLGAIGSRWDHSLANIFLLEQLLEKGIHAVLWDASNRLYLAKQSFRIKKEEAFGTYFSLLPLTETVEGVTLTGFRYPVQNMTFHRKYTLGVSNEITEKEAMIEFSKGKFLVIESQDKEKETERKQKLT